MNINQDICNFCNNVQLLRRSKGLSQRAMAEIMGIGIGSLRKIEYGILPPRLTVDVLFRLYCTFGISPQDLLSHCIEE